MGEDAGAALGIFPFPFVVSLCMFPDEVLSQGLLGDMIFGLLFCWLRKKMYFCRWII